MSEERRRALKRLLACISLANLLALESWLFLFSPAQETPLPGTQFAGAIGALLVMTMALWTVSRIPELISVSAEWRLGMRMLGLTFVWLLIIWAAVRPSVTQELQHLLGILSRAIVAALVATLICAGLALLWRVAGRAVNVMSTISLVLSPYAAINVAHATWEVTQRGLSPNHVITTVDVPILEVGEHRTRTVVLLFDEFDYELAFDPAVRRDPLPILDSLRPLALFATQAYPPMHSTSMSIPAMLTGKLVRKSVNSSAHPGENELRFEDGSRGLLSTQETLFTDMRAKGLTSLRLNDALLPAVRLVGPGDADIVVPPAPEKHLTVAEHAATRLVAVAALIPLVTKSGLDIRLSRLFGLPTPSDHVSQVASQIVDLVGDARSDLLFLHILLPHLPVVFDPKGRGFGAVGTAANYRDNISGVDYVMGRVIARLRERGRLADTHLVVVSDHFYRFKRADYGIGDHRIPFIAIFAGDKSPVGDFNKPFNTVLFRSMLSEITKGEIRDSVALSRWIEKNATYGESPLTQYRKGW